MLPGLAAERHLSSFLVANGCPAAGAGGDDRLDSVMNDAGDPGFLLRDLRRRERPEHGKHALTARGSHQHIPATRVHRHPTLDRARTLLNGACRTTESSTRTLPSPSPPSETGHPSGGTLPRKRKQTRKSHASVLLTETLPRRFLIASPGQFSVPDTAGIALLRIGRCLPPTGERHVGALGVGAFRRASTHVQATSGPPLASTFAARSRARHTPDSPPRDTPDTTNPDPTTAADSAGTRTLAKHARTSSSSSSRPA